MTACEVNMIFVNRKLVRLHDLDGDPILVNPGCIVMAYPYSDGTTNIVFLKDSMNVKESLEQVCEAFEVQND
jgi:hypothetical protein